MSLYRRSLGLRIGALLIHTRQKQQIVQLGIKQCSLCIRDRNNRSFNSEYHMLLIEMRTKQQIVQLGIHHVSVWGSRPAHPVTQDSRRLGAALLIYTRK